MKYLDVSELLAVERIAKAVEAYTLAAEVPKESATSMKAAAKAVRLWAEVGQFGRAVAMAEVILEALIREPDPNAKAAAQVVERSAQTLGRRQ